MLSTGYNSPDDGEIGGEFEEDPAMWSSFTEMLSSGDASTLALEGEATPANLLNVPRNSISVHNQNSVSSFNSVLAGPSRKTTDRSTIDSPTEFAKTLSEKLAGPWIEHAFQKLECSRFIPTESAGDRCGCGRLVTGHSQAALTGITNTSPLAALFASTTQSRLPPQPPPGSWSITENTCAAKTDAFGTIVFQGGAHAHKAQYVRLAYDSDPEEVCYLLEKVWVLPPPRLVISVHGGMGNFEIQEKLGRLFREGLLKAAQTTGAWILTYGTDSGVVRHVAKALDEAGISARMRSRIVIIGIVAWGALRRKERLVGKEITVLYDQHTFHSKTGWGVLNDRHSYFLLVDNGTSGRHGAEVALRRKLEEHLADTNLQHGYRKVPLVCTVLEGGTHTISAVHHYLTGIPGVPVIVCDGSGRAADLLAFAKRNIESDGQLSAEARVQLESMVISVLASSSISPFHLIELIEQCVRHDQLLTVFRYGENKDEDVDHAILTAILKRQNLSLPDQLALALAWNRVDVAKACLASSGRAWPAQCLHQAMTDALRLNRVEFVECLLENGVSMKSFLTIERLEQLYNLDEDSMHSVRLLDPEDNGETVRYLTLPDIGEIVERLMGNAYKCSYLTRLFRLKYEARHRGGSGIKGNRRTKRTLVKERPTDVSSIDEETDFAFPFNELMIWAVLSRRPEMTRCMWQHGEDALVKCQTAIRLYKSIANLAEQEYLELEVAKKLRQHAAEFKKESLSLLEHCYRADNVITVSLLTAEMPRWGHHTVLSLAVLANNKAFLAHQCCQLLLAELWHGGIRLRSRSNLRVLFGLLCPPAALTLAYRQQEEKENEEKPTKTKKKDAEEAWRQAIWRVQETNKTHWRERNKSMGGQLAEILKRSIGRKANSLNSRGQSDSEPILEWNGPRKPDPRLSIVKKFASFYTAPITKFWAWALFFHIFLIAFSNVLVVEMQAKPIRTEWFLLAYMGIFGLEHLRKLLALDLTWKESFRVFFNRYWNLFTTIAILFFLIGFAFRMSSDGYTRKMYGRSMLCFSNVLWHIKTLEYLSISPLLGTYIHMGAKMVVAMSYIVILLIVSMAAFGVTKQAIHDPRPEWDWVGIRNIFFQPYFMLYGEVYAGDIDRCNDEGIHCVPGNWIPPFIMVIFLLVANILLINMLIAIFNNIFNDAITKSQEIYLFERYQQVLEYTDTPLLPPPFTILPLIYRALAKIWRSCKQNSRQNKGVNSVMKTFLDDDGMRRVHDFEEDCMDDMMRERRKREKETHEVTLRHNAEQIESISQKMHEMSIEGVQLRYRLIEMEKLIEQSMRVRNQSITRQDHNRYEMIPSASSHSLPDTNMSHSSGIASIKRPKTPPKKCEFDSITEGIPLTFVVPENYRHSSLYGNQRQRRRLRLHSSSVSINADISEMEKTLNL